MKIKQILPYKKQHDKIRFSSFVVLIADAKEQEMCLSEIWNKTQALYYYSHPDFPNPIINMGSMKRDIKMAIAQDYLTMTGKKSTTKYVKTKRLMAI